MFTKDSFVKAISPIVIEIRMERRIRQEEMAEVLGISRKTLVQIEKGRRNLSWTEAVCVATLFKDSPTLEKVLGGNPIDVLSDINYLPKNKERIVSPDSYWWEDVMIEGTYTIQQNIISKQYRIIDDRNIQLFSSFDYEENLAVLKRRKDS